MNLASVTSLDADQSTTVLAMDELITMIKKAHSTNRQEQLIREENALGIELYSLLNSSENVLNRFRRKAGSFVMCHGIRILLDENRLTLRLRSPMPFPASFLHVDMDSCAKEYALQTRDLIHRFSLDESENEIPQVVSCKLSELAQSCRNSEQFLIEAAEIDPVVRSCVRKLRTAELELRERLAKKEPVL